MAKKVLIFFPPALKKNFGGAYTYLYHLKNSFQSTEVELSFVSDLIDYKAGDDNRSTLSGFRRVIKFMVPDKIIYSLRINRYLKTIQETSLKKDIEKIDFAAYDVIHFHETVYIWVLKDLLKEYKGKVILTSHSPKPYHLELLEDVFHLTPPQISKQSYKNLEAIDTVAFEKADVIVAPCKEAIKAYEDCWPLFKALVEKKKQVFIPTSIEVTQPAITHTEMRKRLHIPEDGFVVCFNGRHNKTKGYDLVVESANHLLHKFPGIYFIITGKQDNPPLIKHKQWIETGWIDTPENFINAADVVVVPNRQTYFDLNVLQALSLGKTLAISNTGGNNYFKQFESPAILFFTIAEENALTATILKSYQNKALINGEVNRELFQQQFTLNKFAQAYNQFYLSI